jgi:hypothetical protein
MDPTIARKTWRTLEPVHGMIYFAPDATEIYGRAGIDHHRTAYFASRSAAMGAVPAEVVIATFFNFEPGLVRRSIPSAWTSASPERILDARLELADVSLRRAFGDALGSHELAETTALARQAAEAACEHPEGRPLFAGHASLPWPDEPHLVLWHAQSLLREYRGDGHVAALVGEGLDGVEALVTHAASGDVPSDVLRATRAWTQDAWDAAVDRLRSRGLVEHGSDVAFTDAGRALRQRIEDLTDVRATRPYEAIGEDGCDRLRALGRDLSRRVVDAGLLRVDPSRYVD